jgi:hypothetical protein
VGIPFFKAAPNNGQKKSWVIIFVTWDFTKNIGAGLYFGFYPRLGTALQFEEGL